MSGLARGREHGSGSTYSSGNAENSDSTGVVVSRAAQRYFELAQFMQFHSFVEG